MTQIINHKHVWNLEFRIWNLFRISNFVLRILFVLGILLYAYKADAGLIVQRPLYVGLTNGLVGYWSFDQQDMAGERAYDKSGNSNTGTLTNGPTRAIGRIGQALEFGDAGSSDEGVNAGKPSSLNNLPAISISIWAYGRSYGGSNQGALISKTGGSDAGWTFQYYVTGNKLLFEVQYTAPGSDLRVEVSNVSDTWNQWVHWAVTWDGSTSASNVHIFKNGVEVSPSLMQDASGTRSSESSRDFYVGNSALTGRAFDGFLDEARIYNRALSPDEIKRLYKIGSTLKINVPRKDTLTEGLVGYWTFDGPDMAGVKAYDRSGNSNTGTLTNGPVRRIGRIGQALSFDGSDDYVDAGSGASLDDLGPMTINAWVYPRTRGESNLGLIIAKEQTDITNGWVLRFSYSGTELNLVVDYSTTNLNRGISSSLLPLNTWSHVIVTWDGSTVASNAKIYINGSEASSYARTQNAVGDRLSDAAYNLNIGNIQGSQTWDGLIDDVRIYNRALSPDEIKRLYKIGSTLKVNVPRKDTLQEGLVGYWTFDGPDMAGERAYDRSGQNNNGTLTNGPVRRIGRIGQALNFDGDNDLVNLASPAVLDNLPAITLSAWIFPRTLGENSAGVIVTKSSAGAVQGWTFRFNSNPAQNLRFTAWYDNNTAALDRRSSANTIVLNTWQHVVLAWDGSSTAANARFYKNGIETGYVTTINGGTTRDDDSAQTAIIGNVGTGSTFDGLIDDVRVYNRALSPDEIKRLYQVGR